MSTDNRTLLNDCSAAFTGGDDTGAPTTLSGLFYETSALSVQFTNADERTFTTNIGGTRDLSDATCYMLAKDNLIQTQALGGVKYVLYDGTNEIGYEVGGNDNTGIPLTPFFNGYKLDVSNSATFLAHAFAGSEVSLVKTSITGVGYGTNHLAKAQGSIDNCFLDQFFFMANGSPALTINGGTVGTPITMTQTSADDITNGWGLVSNPQGKQFNIFAPTEWGDAGAANTYFSEEDSQITLIGTGIGAGNFDMRNVCNTTGTNLFKLKGCVVINLGAAANWDLSDANSDTMAVDTTQFVDNGAFTFPVTGGTDRHCNDATFVNCGQVNPSTMEFLRNTFIGTTDANGALLANKDLDSMTFTSDGAGHAIYITTPGSYDYTLNSFNGYGVDTSTDAAIYNNSGGAVTINVNSGDTPTFRNGVGASTTIVAGAVTTKITATNSETKAAVEGAAVVVRAASTSGGLPFEDTVTITRSGNIATVSHAAHGLDTNQWVEIENADQNEYNRLKQITVTTANEYTYVVEGSPTTPATGAVLSTAVLINGRTDALGAISDTRTLAVDQNFTGSVRKTASNPVFVSQDLSDVISKSTGFLQTVALIPD